MTDEKTPFHNPFASALQGLRRSTPAPAASAAAPSASTNAGKIIPRAVVRYERSGRGGKEVTVIEQLTLSLRDREEWLRALKAALGCGGKIEGDALMLQGDQRERLPNLLRARGVKKITVA